MTETELWDALDGLMAYDLGATDSGIHDEALRQRVKDKLSDDAVFTRVSLSMFIRERMLSDDALKTGYSIEDVKEFLDWLCNEMDYCF